MTGRFSCRVFSYPHGVAGEGGYPKRKLFIFLTDTDGSRQVALYCDEGDVDADAAEEMAGLCWQKMAEGLG